MPPHGERGIVVDVKVFTREENTDLSAGVDKWCVCLWRSAGRLPLVTRWLVAW